MKPKMSAATAQPISLSCLLGGLEESSDRLNPGRFVRVPVEPGRYRVAVWEADVIELDLVEPAATRLHRQVKGVLLRLCVRRVEEPLAVLVERPVGRGVTDRHCRDGARCDRVLEGDDPPYEIESPSRGGSEASSSMSYSGLSAPARWQPRPRCRGIPTPTRP